MLRSGIIRNIIRGISNARLAEILALRCLVQLDPLDGFIDEDDLKEVMGKDAESEMKDRGWAGYLEFLLSLGLRCAAALRAL